MDETEEQTSFQMPDLSTTTKYAVSELLEDAGNCRQSANQELSLHLLSDSLFSEQQKLRHVLDWANGYLCSGSVICHEICRADSLITDIKNKGTKKISSKHSSAPKYHHPVSFDASTSEVYGGGSSMKTTCQSRSLNDLTSSCSSKFSYDLHSPVSFSPATQEENWPETETENIKSTEQQQATNKHISSQDYHRTNRFHMSNLWHHTFTSDAATHLIKESTSSGSDTICKQSTAYSEVNILNLLLENNNFSGTTSKRAGAKREVSESEKALRKEDKQMEENEKKKIQDDRIDRNYRKERESSSDQTHSQISLAEPEMIPEQKAKTANSHFIHPLKLSLNLNVYEQYQLCVAQLNRLRISQHFKPESPEKEGMTSGEMGDYVKAPACPGSCFELNSHITNPEIKKQVNNTGRKRATTAESAEEKSSHGTNKTLDDHRNAKSCSNLTVKKTPADITAYIKETAEERASDDESKPGDVYCVEKNAAPVSGLLQNKIRHHPDSTDHQRILKDPKRRTGDRVHWILTDKTLGERHQQAIKYTKKLNSNPQPVQTHTLHHDDSGLTSCEYSAVDVNMDNTIEYQSAGVSVRDRWLCLPDEVWLSILSLLPHRDLSRVVQICHRLHALASDHSLWKNLRLENSALTDQWLLCVGRRCPRSVFLYSCSGLSVSSCGLQMFFSLCRNSLKELKVTSCTGPGLHGDQMLSVISQFCDHVTSVDVSWSGATDTGVKALTDCRKGLKSVVMNGCHVTDAPLKKLVMKHKDRLEVFGCQFLTPSWLQTVYEMCPGLQHLNIGRVPKITVNSLTRFTARLNDLISLNLTGQQVTHAIVDTLLQNCSELQSLSFSSCPGVTDLTLNSISKYSPCIRVVDVSGCKAVTDAGVQSLALGCRRLQQLDLSSTCTGNRGVSLLANYCNRHLHTIKLSFCHITVKKILKLCQHCTRLKVLHLYGCAHLPTEREIKEVNSTVTVSPLS